MQGTKHENDWVFYHDALSLMTSRECKDWMVSKKIGNVSYMDKWLVPCNGCNAGTKYYGRPVGNLPKFMPLDMSLNYDIKRSHEYHCALTYHLNDKHIS